ncbi:putative membrane protein YeaQ/YmgE (transglycosylase-associated protein family) [Endobacter medicaginis]|uniref:GlsB/YeaQ/YmgE family stress response membrane protein n=1 Tax=Endobacter medicaginis TaxID=1181271 RepID=A0A839UW70_9PROT|nr:GlsB/YeaQ/YmgE family stress response membrane protein [Endobacter medicaginis]MBB3174538.1 putative membrane protein YeaQ/YmgE (transglycosylase-associated protein family) [Endobacter medicaginis]MCX5477290.1 GlsB/YeaQ/YmgE family stress response membrane protein [Endobacter medicaginis]NVN29645.1 GlsB/YeaQ/YmgE family stress response membrane protein [Endobacter medicaginis]
MGHGIIVTIILGFIIGLIAKFLMPGRDPGGFIVTIILGILGSVVAGYIGRALHWYGPGQPAGFIASIFGAILLLIIYRVVIGNRTTV